MYMRVYCLLSTGLYIGSWLKLTGEHDWWVFTMCHSYCFHFLLPMETNCRSSYFLITRLNREKRFFFDVPWISTIQSSCYNSHKAFRGVPTRTRTWWFRVQFPVPANFLLVLLIDVFNGASTSVRASRPLRGNTGSLVNDARFYKIILTFSGLPIYLVGGLRTMGGV